MRSGKKIPIQSKMGVWKGGDGAKKPPRSGIVCLAGAAEKKVPYMGHEPMKFGCRSPKSGVTIT